MFQAQYRRILSCRCTGGSPSPRSSRNLTLLDAGNGNGRSSLGHGADLDEGFLKGHKSPVGASGKGRRGTLARVMVPLVVVLFVVLVLDLAHMHDGVQAEAIDVA